MKKYVIVLFTMLLLVSRVFAGGGSQQSGGAAPSTGPVLTDDRSKTLDITWWGFNQPGILPLNGSIIQRELEKRYNIHITNIMSDSYNIEQQNLLVATGVQFDFWSGQVQVGSLRQRADTGLIRPISMDMMRRFAPDIVRILDNESTKWPAIASVDGVFYGFPVVGEPLLPIGLAVRTDWLRNLGVTALPNTLDELEALLVRFRNDDPDRNGRKDTYALAMSANLGDPTYVNPYLFASYGVQIERWGIDTDGSPKWYATDDNYRQALIKLSEWWAKEIYDPTILVNATRADNYLRVANGFTAGYFGVDWQLALNVNDVPGFQGLWRNSPGSNADDFITTIPPVRGPNGTSTYSVALYLRTSISTFGRNTSDEKVVRILSMLNDIYSQEDLFLLTYYGFEGQHWDFNTTGQIVVRPEWNTLERQTEIGGQRFLNHAFIPFEFLNATWAPARMAQHIRMRGFPQLPIHFASLFDTVEDTDFGSATRDISREYFWKTITGEWDVNSTWNDYVNRWNAAGGRQIIEAKKQLAIKEGLN